MIIRQARSKDLSAIADMMQTEYLKHYDERWTDENTKKTLDYYSEIGHIFVAESDNMATGFVIVREEFYNTGKSIMVEELVVEGTHQGKGIGKRLMRFVEDYCRKHNISFIWLITSKKAAAFEFYKKIGYTYKPDTAYFSKEIA